MIEQSQWRKGGMVCLVVAASMAVFSVPSGLLRHSIYKIFDPLNEQVTAPDDATSWWILGPYWLIFSAILFAALYLAFLDIRYIRLQFLSEKRKLFEETMRDPSLFQKESKAEPKETDTN